MDLARGVRQVRPDIPIILSSGYADEVPEETLKALGIVGGPAQAVPDAGPGGGRGPGDGLSKKSGS